MFIADHVLFGLVLTELRSRPQRNDRVDPARARAGRGRRAGRRLPAVRAPAGGRAGARGLRAQRRARRGDRGGGRRRRRSRRCSPAWRPTRRRSRGRDRRHRGRAARAARRGFAIAASTSAAARPTRSVSPDTATCDGVPARAVRPRRPPPPLPVHQLHRLRPALHDRARRPVRPAADHDGRLHDVRALPAEYDDPADRRFHAQPNACPDLRPRLRVDRCVGRLAAVDPLAARWRCSQAGGIVAVKGIGGFHLACLAADERRGRRAAGAQAPRGEAVRADGARPRGGGRARAGRAARGGAAARARPADRARAAAAGARVAAAVAPLAPELGVMLPYSPLHHLLLADVGEPLVMTSGNVSDEPIAYEDEDALARLAGIADAFLLHDRPIETRTDDSVLRSRAGGRCRCGARAARSRACSRCRCPPPATCSRCGAELKSTFCLARGRRAWVSHHIGDLKNVETLGSFEPASRTSSGCSRSRRRSSRTTCTPTTCRPPTRSPARASSASRVQHHHAHLAACLAEHGETGPAVGAIFDGAGLGQRRDGVGRRDPRRRPARLRARRAPVAGARFPGGDRAAREPWRMACAWRVGGRRRRAAAAPASTSERWRAVAQIAETGLGSPPTTSVGRLFDAVAALCGLRAARSPTRARRRWSSRPPATAPSAAPTRCARSPACSTRARRSWRSTATSARGVGVGTIAARFHHALADATAAECAQLAADRGLEHRRAVGRRVPEPPAARAHRRRARAGGPARARARAAAAERRRDRFGQAAVAAARLS